jgi:hypothetical protein
VWDGIDQICKAAHEVILNQMFRLCVSWSGASGVGIYWNKGLSTGEQECQCDSRMYDGCVYGHIQPLPIPVCRPHMLQQFNHCACTKASYGNWTKSLSPSSTHFCHHEVLCETSQGPYHLHLARHPRPTTILWLEMIQFANDFVLYNTRHCDVTKNDFSDGGLELKYVANIKQRS